VCRSDVSDVRARRTPDVRRAVWIGTVHRPPHARLSRCRCGCGLTPPPNWRARGRPFHRTTVEFTESYPPAWAYRGRHEALRDGAVHAGVHASYLHTHPAAAPVAVARFITHAARSKLAR
jgi:hypothetical protein